MGRWIDNGTVTNLRRLSGIGYLEKRLTDRTETAKYARHSWKSRRRAHAAGEWAGRPGARPRAASHEGSADPEFDRRSLDPPRRERGRAPRRGRRRPRADDGARRRRADVPPGVQERREGAAAPVRLRYGAER